ncbi:MAG TPA: LptF/LptG family permease [bacterium]|nr:LptF/LptG family permease [bacterium]HQG44100.1 LptF/LptG family permease [bacterium]HQI48992.1 LptF/LptG family permease [bacterium]HQJ65075.1 LptF/LptG family permease [bacterium]
MNLLDRYLLRKFIGVLVFALFAFICIFIIVDGIEKLDTFLDKQVPYSIIFKLYLYYTPYIITLTLPVAMLLSSLFSVGTMAKQNEIVAQIASGRSLYRILTPVFLLALIISLGAIWFGEAVVPRASASRAQLIDQYVEKQREIWRKRVNNVYARDDQERRINMRWFDTVSNTGHMINIRRFAGLELELHIYASRMEWQDSTWVLFEGVERLFTQGAEQVRTFDKMVLEGENLRPADFAKILKKPEEMSYRELSSFIVEVERNGGDPNHWLVDLYHKIAIPFANFIIVLFGAPLSSPKRRSGTATGFGISLAVCFIYFGIVKTAQSMGQNGLLSPLIAAWSANLIFFVAGIWVLLKAPK